MIFESLEGTESPGVIIPWWQSSQDFNPCSSCTSYTEYAANQRFRMSSIRTGLQVKGFDLDPISSSGSTARMSSQDWFTVEGNRIGKSIVVPCRRWEFERQRKAWFRGGLKLQ